MTTHCTALPRPCSRASAGETGGESLKHLANCLSVLRTTDGYHLVIRNPLTLRYPEWIRISQGSNWFAREGVAAHNQVLSGGLWFQGFTMLGPNYI